MTALLLLLAGPAQLAAQQIRSPYRFLEERRSAGIFAGPVRTNPGRLDLGPQSGTAASVRLSARFGDSPFGVDAGIGYLPTTRLVWDIPEDEVEPEQVGETDLNLAVVDAALRFDVTGPRTWRNLLPYILFGGGFAAQIGESRMPDEELELEPDMLYRFGTRFAAEFGGGVEWFASRRFTVRLDARNVLWQIAVPTGFVERQPQVPSREWTQNLWLTLGLTYRF